MYVIEEGILKKFSITVDILKKVYFYIYCFMSNFIAWLSNFSIVRNDSIEEKAQGCSFKGLGFNELFHLSGFVSSIHMLKKSQAENI